MDPVSEAALEAIPIEQGEEELKVLFLAVVRRSRHEQKMSGERGKKLPELETFGIVDLAAEEGSGHLVCLVADHQVPATIGRLELLLKLLVTGQLVESGNDQVCLHEPVPRPRGLELVVGEDLEGQVEALVELVLPLLGQAAGAYDEAALEIAPRDKFLDEEPRHDGLACTRIIRKKEPKGLAGQHGLVDSSDLVRQRVDDGGMNSEHWVEEMREPDALGF